MSSSRFSFGSSSSRAHASRTLAALLLASAAAMPASGHHSAALFDTSKQAAVEGVVTKYDWRNPHVYMSLRTTEANGATIDQEIEAGASSVLLPLGLKPDSVAIGERVIVRGNPSKQGAGHTMLGRELVKADGSVLPLNIGSTASRVAPQGVSATSIAGTWLPRREQFGAFAGGGRWSLTERGRAAAAAFDPRGAAYVDCIPVTAPTLMLYPVTSVVEVDKDVAKLRVDWMSSERVVYLDGRGHPANAAPSLQGHSTGRWEGGTLVVDTTQFAEHRQGNSMTLPSGARKHLVERFALSDDRKHLKYDVVLEDHDYLAAPVTYSAEWDYRPDLAPTGLPCDREVARRFLTQQ